MNKTEFQVDKIYTLNIIPNTYILKALGNSQTGAYINVLHKEFSKQSSFGTPGGYEEATEEEANWLLECIKENKFVEKPIIHSYSIY